ncbi:hypothetical protein QYG06_22940 [Xanthomonas euvesicatoria]|uniref:23S rRNA G2069 N7-methylase RlmK/C1962 C5-methylase RlmI n=3 Tax=Xanthomonas TaxID=338 RepID=A0AB73H4D9_9XANT|nr:MULTISPECIES: hypothetical protein [Xanthomonas]AOY69367.1 hypothetical protein BHE83_22570 [Xanthomonas euvesicatoria pv. vesicatoria str. 85-10]APO88673.1 hypothetical protein BJD11_00410 [Xanthomonas euvesicatoria]KHL52364.1 hypothetical protein XEU66b_22655 [Xanthomonas euvesicatoria]KLB37764.1 hypothetical protein XEUV206_22225 [Xanthomonas euvesicatoria]KLB44617.1 hypothetical protein XEUV259_19480 [Xanthomonas euvesicatoria]
MSLNDFIDGQLVNNTFNRRAVAETANNRDEWMAEAKRLRRELEATIADRDTWKAHGTASIELVRDLRENLAQSSPANPFADRNRLNERLKARKVELVQQMGYRVINADADNFTITR